MAQTGNAAEWEETIRLAHDNYRDIIGVRNEEGAEVKQLALAHNRKERGVLLPELFPAPPVPVTPSTGQQDSCRAAVGALPVSSIEMARATSRRDIE